MFWLFVWYSSSTETVASDEADIYGLLLLDTVFQLSLFSIEFEFE